jgi:hypothetical protein
MKNLFGLKGVSTLLIAFVLVLTSCKKDESALSATDSQNVNSESATDSYNDDSQDMASLAVNNVDATQFEGGRVGGRTDGNGDVVAVIPWQTLDDRLKCAAITIVRTNTKGTTPAGTITIDFDTNPTCEDLRKVKRKGKISIEYFGARFSVDSYIKITFKEYYRNGVKVEGVLTLTIMESTTQGFPKYTVNITGGKITFADGTKVSRNQNFIREWQRNANPALDKWAILVGSEASGKTKTDKDYSMIVTKDIIFSRACVISNQVFIPVSGTKTFIVDKKITYLVDYGTGNCDNDIIVSVGGASKTITVGADGN